ncbi:MAG: cytochrome c551/c552, partial [Akkermansiaceae bacterium]
MFIIWLIGKKKAGKAQNCEFLPTRVIRGGVEFFRDIRVPADILVCPMHLARTLALLVALASSASAAGVEFNRDIRPILSNKCFACHGPDAKAREAKLRLDQRESALAVIEPGSPEKSELIARVTHTDRDEVMPPVETHKSI